MYTGTTLSDTTAGTSEPTLALRPAPCLPASPGPTTHPVLPIEDAVRRINDALDQVLLTPTKAILQLHVPIMAISTQLDMAPHHLNAQLAIIRAGPPPPPPPSVLHRIWLYLQSLILPITPEKSEEIPTWASDADAVAAQLVIIHARQVNALTDQLSELRRCLQSLAHARAYVTSLRHTVSSSELVVLGDFVVHRVTCLRRWFHDVAEYVHAHPCVRPLVSVQRLVNDGRTVPAVGTGLVLTNTDIGQCLPLQYLYQYDE